MTFQTTLRGYYAAQKVFEALPLEDTRRLQAQADNLLGMCHDVIDTPPATLEDLLDKISFIQREHDAENDLLVAAALAILKSDVIKMWRSDER